MYINALDNVLDCGIYRIADDFAYLRWSLHGV